MQRPIKSFGIFQQKVGSPIKDPYFWSVSVKSRYYWLFEVLSNKIYERGVAWNKLNGCVSVSYLQKHCRIHFRVIGYRLSRKTCVRVNLPQIRNPSWNSVKSKSLSTVNHSKIRGGDIQIIDPKGFNFAQFNSTISSLSEFIESIYPRSL